MYLLQLNISQLESVAAPRFARPTIGQIFNELLPFVFAAAGILTILFLISGGLQLLLSRGDPKAVEGAKGKITGALMGLGIVILSYLIVQAVGVIFGITEFSNIFG